MSSLNSTVVPFRSICRNVSDTKFPTPVVYCNGAVLKYSNQSKYHRCFTTKLSFQSSNSLPIAKIHYPLARMCWYKHHHLRILWVLVLLSQSFQSLSWFFSSKDTHYGDRPSENPEISGDVVAEFSMEQLNDKKGMQLVEKAVRKAASSDSCWQNAYQNLLSGCSEILAGEEKRSRLAWHLSDCFQKDTGRTPFPYCDVKSSMVNCLKKLDVDAHRVYLEFYLETNSICHQLQTDAFKRQTERLVNELKVSAENAERKLDNIQDQAEDILQSADNIHNSLDSIDIQTQQIAQISKDVEDRVTVVMKHSVNAYEQSLKIAASQVELHEGQVMMKEQLAEGMTMVNESYNNLGVEISNLRDETLEIEKEIVKVGDTMALKMETLQSKAIDIENKAETSLDNQRQLLESQIAAQEVIQSVTKFQSQALEESRDTLQQLLEFGHRQQQELIRRQEQLERAHDHLVESSKTILAAQETFELKQANMFLAIDKLFTLHNAILLESRAFKALIMYSIWIFFLYMLTSTKYTYGVRPRLFFGLCATLLIEFVVLWYGNDFELQAWIIKLVRAVSVILSLIQLFYAFYTYRDYESLNHQMLLTLMDKVNNIQKHKELAWDMHCEDDDIDSEDWSTWVDSELPEDVDKLVDPDFMLPEEIGENSLTTSVTRQYNLRNRRYS